MIRNNQYVNLRTNSIFRGISMARPREFDEIEAMDSAVSVFMSKGYEASSLMDLLKSMKLSKSSLYNSFGTKHELFLAAIDHYAIAKEKQLLECVSRATGAREKLQCVINAMLDVNNPETGLRGCLLHNCALEVLPQDNIAAERIANGIGRIRAICVNIISEGQGKGEISQKRSADELGDLFINSLYGYLSVARAMKEQDRLRGLSSMILETIA